jgi:hypothetical protein
MSFPEIGRFMGNKNHSTVILACRRISKMVQEDAIVQWMTPEGLKEQRLSIVLADVEEQFRGSRPAPVAGEPRRGPAADVLSVVA